MVGTTRNAIDAIGDPYERLAAAIILTAVDDYKKAATILRSCPESLDAQRVTMDCEKFFRSGWFASLTDICGQELENRILERIARQRGRSPRKKARI